jgi:hypothetical protein
MQLLKGNSPKWLLDTFPELIARGFAWQQDFDAFSIGVERHRPLHPEPGRASSEKDLSGGV